MGASQSSPGGREGACAEPCGAEFGAAVAGACTFYVDDGHLCCGCDATACALDTIPVGAPTRRQGIRELPGPSDPAAAARAQQQAARRQQQSARRKIRLGWSTIVQTLGFLATYNRVLYQGFRKTVENNLPAIMKANTKDSPMAQANYAKVFDVMPDAFGQEGLWEATKDESLVPSVLKFAKKQTAIEQYMMDQIEGTPMEARPALVDSWAQIVLEKDDGQMWNKIGPVLDRALNWFDLNLWMLVADADRWVRHGAYNILAASVESGEFWGDEGLGAGTSKAQYDSWIAGARAAGKNRAAAILERKKAEWQQTGRWENFE